MLKKIIVALAALLCLSAVAEAEECQVAVAANFTKPAQDIAAAFEKATGHKALLSFGSTGNFYAQIKNGAPFAALLAADAPTPAKLAAEGLAVAESRFTYAQGALALWSAQEGFVGDNGEALKKGQFTFLAVADPQLAPYGAAAYELLDALKLTESLKGKIVTGNNIGQAFQFAESGQAELGLVAWSQVCRGGRLARGSAWLVPADLYSPIRQDAILLKAGEGSAAAKAFLAFLKDSPEAQAVIEGYGYALP